MTKKSNSTLTIPVLFFFLTINYYLLAISPFPAHAQIPSENVDIVCLKADKVNDVQEIVKLSGTRLNPLKRVELWRDVAGVFTCAVDRNGVSTCGAGAPTAGTGFQVLTATRDQIKPNANQQLTLDQVKSTGGRGDIRSRPDGSDQSGTNSTPHVFYAVQQVGTTELDANSVALKLKNFNIKVGVETHCVTISWTETKRIFDPYGRVFDAISLEPITDAQVVIYDSQKRQIPNRPGVVNPQIVNKAAWFVYLVPDGTYYLSASRSSLSFPVDAATIARLNGAQAIYSDLYAGEPIVQSGGIIQHRDIPLMPADPLRPTNTRPEFASTRITRYQVLKKVYHLIFGQVSHPFSFVSARFSGRELAKVQSDKFGNFELRLVNDELDVQQPVELIAEKVSLTSLRTTSIKAPWWNIFSFIPSVRAQNTNTTSYPEKVYPLPNFIQGKITLPAGKIPPGTKVELFIPGMMNDRVATTTTVRDDGTISVDSRSVPPLQFEMRVVDAKGNELKSYSPHAFVAENKSYLVQKKVNLLAVQKTAADFTTTPVPTLENNGVMPTGILNVSDKSAIKSQVSNTKLPSFAKASAGKQTPNNLEQFNNPQQLSNSNNPIIVVLFVAIIGAVVGGGIYLMKRKQG